METPSWSVAGEWFLLTAHSSSRVSVESSVVVFTAKFVLPHARQEGVASQLSKLWVQVKPSYLFLMPSYYRRRSPSNSCVHMLVLQLQCHF